MYNSTDPAEADAQAAEEAKKYSVFWKEFGKAIKLGIIEDAQNRQRLAKLLRFETSRSGGKQIGLDAYITGMKEGQKSMYYLAGESTRVILHPHKQLQAFTSAWALVLPEGLAMSGLAALSNLGHEECLTSLFLVSASIFRVLGFY